MPAPIAKGKYSAEQAHGCSQQLVFALLPPKFHQSLTRIIIAATIIVAAGIAVYESPQVREFVNKGRRKLAIALHTLGEEIHPHARHPSSVSDDNGPEAEELQRLRRAEIIERNRDKFLKQREAEIAEREKGKRRSPESGYASFDDFLSQDAEKTGTYTIRNTSTVHPDHEEGLRRRAEGVRGLERGGAFANPFVDPIGEEEASQVLFDATLMGASRESLHNEKTDDGDAAPRSRETTATLPAEPLGGTQPPPAEAPTSRLDLSTPNTATSSPDPPAQPFQPSAYWSVVHEWAENTPPSYYHANSEEHHSEHQQPQPQGQHPDTPQINNNTSPAVSSTPSLVGSGEEIHMHDGSIDGDVMSDAGSASSVGSWTEVGSEVSDGDHGDH